MQSRNPDDQKKAAPSPSSGKACSDTVSCRCMLTFFNCIAEQSSDNEDEKLFQHQQNKAK